jgi:hypothetical protein
MGLLSKAVSSEKPVNESCGFVSAKIDDFDFDGGGLLARASHSAGEPGEKDSSGRYLREILDETLKKYAALAGLVFEAENTGDGFAGRIAFLTAGFATVSDMGRGRCLILGDPSLDFELLTHRLSASIQGKKVFSFSADNSEKAFGALEPYI